MFKTVIVLFFTIILAVSHPLYANYASKLCQTSFYTCIKVKRHQTWKGLFPEDAKRDLIMRINRTNTPLYRGELIAIPKSTDQNMMDYSPMPKQIPATQSKVIVVSLAKEAFGAYDNNGNLLLWGPVSTGEGYCSDIHRGCHTPIGEFIIQYKEGPDCKSTKFPVGKGGAPMPWCMYFHRGFALHGSYEVPGYNASHGCVRMFVNDAKWLNQNFTRDGETRVVIKKE